jgi:hypothetical protein
MSPAQIAVVVNLGTSTPVSAATFAVAGISMAVAAGLASAHPVPVVVPLVAGAWTDGSGMARNFSELF